MQFRPPRTSLRAIGRDGRGNTAVGAFSPRARPGFPIARPVTWSQVEGRIRPDAFNIDRPLRAAVRKAA
ncbi:hypothetical protein [Mesorhizobium sp. BR1-1-7]|uniref:non-homologous end-joining DNA ligase LigD n=1 Tax=Mesorhizobium sp. BR1-1-7 TaxID=2876647 RepID=UPI00398D38DF